MDYHLTPTLHLVNLHCPTVLLTLNPLVPDPKGPASDSCFFAHIPVPQLTSANLALTFIWAICTRRWLIGCRSIFPVSMSIQVVGRLKCSKYPLWKTFFIIPDHNDLLPLLEILDGGDPRGTAGLRRFCLGYCHEQVEVTHDRKQRFNVVTVDRLGVEYILIIIRAAYPICFS